jgi:hypothetical protein
VTEAEIVELVGRVWQRSSPRSRSLAAGCTKRLVAVEGAGHALGVSQQTGVEKLTRGELEGVRVRVGARTAWRIHVDSVASDIQPTLFD